MVLFCDKVIFLFYLLKKEHLDMTFDEHKMLVLNADLLSFRSQANHDPVVHIMWYYPNLKCCFEVSVVVDTTVLKGHDKTSAASSRLR